VKYLLDSVVIIDHLNGRAEATAFLERHWEDCGVSVITRAEILTGVTGEAAESVRALLDRFPTLVVDKPAADLAAVLRQSHRWKLPDAIQAALARLNGLKLVTRNARDFDPRKHSFVLQPYR
jgi:predicted nucleic acid-binding protein